MKTSTDIFGRVHLGYVVVETEKFSDWRRFGGEAIGMHVDDALPDTLRFRLDDNACRFLLQRGPAEDATALGWQIDDHATFDTVEARILGHGVPLSEGSAEEAELRGVERFVRFPGPNGLVQEIYVVARTAPEPVRAAASSPEPTEWGTWPSQPRSRIRCAATTTPSSMPGCRTTSTRPSTG
jgi:hypothetical protein